MRISDWSSDVCSSDLDELQQHGDAPADRPARLHGADGTAAVFGTDRLAHQHGAGGPFAAEAETQQGTGDEQLLVILREGAEPGEERKPQDGDRKSVV